jgi:D-threo-aldose 1-dehydrogenase
VQNLEAICQKYTVPLRAVALQFPAAHPAVASLVLGMESDDEVDDALLALSHPVPPELWLEFQAAGLIDESAPLPAVRN